MRRLLPFRAVSLSLFFAVACGGPATRPAASPAARTITLSVIGTNDLHGRLRALPVFAGYVAALRERRREDGAVLLIDGGDMFQGTLESNLLEGAPVVAAYETIGYDAVTIGNHEFDYGPVGPSPIPVEPDDDPRGALRARAAEAGFPFLSANLLHQSDGSRVDWENVPASTLLERGGATVGVIGVTTEETLRTTIAANVVGLRVAPLARAIAREAAALRRRGADVVIVAAHAGGRCERFDDPTDLSSCRPDEEIFEVARQLPAGAVDAIVAGHTHAGVAHVVNGVPIVESYAYGRAFGRVDLHVDTVSRRVVDVRVHPPRDLCAEGSVEADDCAPGSYEGRAIEPDEAVREVLEPAIAHARAQREQPLGVTFSEPVPTDRRGESALGNLVTDLMRAARPTADVAVMNGGALRADLPAGPLDYGELHQAFPFDNRFAFVRLTGAELAAIVAENLRAESSFLSLSGVRAEARCADGALEITLTREDGTPIRTDEALVVATTDFLVTGGDGAFESVPDEAIRIEDGAPLRDELARVLERRGGTISAAALHDPSRPRVRYEGERPITCAGSDSDASARSGGRASPLR